ncbi:MAG: VacB/RNase II family 3'-5' exoribonuclease [Collinsella intestinalis]|uniref:Ribonuclease R n=1 Tax=Collinsella intestinalis TaxID=147207 RepID=A0A943BM86_9ACTN|nr:VacB/RNase II family 3'-5' exoribonuclease [Collinsella intestinalis]
MGRGRHSKNGRRGPARSRRLPGLTGTVRVYDARAEVETAEGVYRLRSRSMREAMPGDRVYVSLHRGKGGARRAVVEHVIDRAVAAIVGVFEPAGPLGAVRPLDTRIKQDFFVLPADDSPRRLGVEPGDIVSARIVDYPSRTESGVVTLERRIGDANEPSLGIECVMARYGLVDGYPQAAVDEAASLAVDVEGALADPLRRDIRDRFAITIDPVDARDFDDAISVARTVRGGWMLGVHIADVSHYVDWESAIDLEARRRSTSVYLADRVLPMLPERLCNDLCSLRPDEDRLAFTVDIELDAQGRVRMYEPYPSVIRSRVRMDYGAADALLREGEPDGAALDAAARGRAELAVEAARANGVDLRAFLRNADALARARREIRRKRGSIDFDTPEVHVLLDEAGMPVDIVTRERTAATSLVEEAMLLANECVAEFLADRDLVSAYRVHEDPSPDSLASAAKTLTELGAVEGGLAAGIMLGDPRAINAAVEDAADTAFAPQVNALLLRAQQRAVYKSHNEGHYALGARAYCHFTSPIRRYPDLIAHRVLKVALAKHELGKKEALVRAPRLTGKGPQALEAICPQLCRQASDNERAADAAANASQKVKVAQLYASRIGERDTGTVSWISDLGAFVRLDATGAEGLVRMNALGAEWWDFDDVRLTLTGESTGTRVGLGCRVVVEVASVNVLRGHLDLKLLHVSGSAS